jgi:membrane dipeptidase
MILADAHADTFYRVVTEGLSVFDDDGPLHINLSRMRRVGQVFQACSVFTPARYSGHDAEQFALRIIHTLNEHLANHPDAFRPVRNRDDVLALGDGRVGLIPWLEGASPLRGDLSVLQKMFDLGVRGVGLTHNHANEVADGCGVPEPRRGLTDFGRQLVERMNDLGVAIDCAHLPQPAFNDVMRATRKPPCITHTGARALVGIVRNADDAMFRAIAERGGVVGIDFYPGHLVPDAFEPGVREATCEDAAAHIAHAVNVCGEDHVMLGGDLDGFNDTCTDLRHLGDLPNLERALRAKRLSEATLEKIFSRNLLRYLSDVLPAE